MATENTENTENIEEEELKNIDAPAGG